MDAERYICMDCQRTYPDPGSCPVCGQDDLLDMRIPSERELLVDQQLAKHRGRKGLYVTLLATFVTVGLELAVNYFAPRHLGMREMYVCYIALLGVYPVIYVLLYRFRKQNPFMGEADAFSEHDPVDWEMLLDDPVPVAEDENEKLRAARARRHSARR